MKHAFTIILILLGTLNSHAGGFSKRSQDDLASSILQLNPDKVQIVIYSLNPEKVSRKGETTGSRFYGYRILGSTCVISSVEKSDLLAAFAHGIRENHKWVGICFNPRHGLRIIRDDKISDFVICFQCSQVYVYGFRPAGQFLISASPQGVFNNVLRRHKIKLAKP